MRLRIMLVVIIFMCFASCRPATQLTTPLNKPLDLGDGIKIGAPEDAGLDTEHVLRVVQEIRDGTYGEIHSFLVYHDGLLVVEEYFPGHDYDWGGPNFHGTWMVWDERRRHNVHSVGKSITSACVGIAVEQGFIKSVQDPISNYLPDYQQLIIGGKEEITIEHLLTMTSGLDWDEWGSSYASSENDVIRLWLECQDPVACILEKPLLYEPGSHFTYSGGNLVLLGVIIKNASGMDIDAFSWEYLFRPLGIEDPPWSWITEDVVYAGGDQLLTPREMLKFGILYLKDGMWDGQRILPDGWVESSTSPYPGADNQWWNSILKTIPPGDSTWGRRGYGYTWWIHDLRVSGKNVHIYYALGFGGQKIFVIPDQQTIVVITSGNYTSIDPAFSILRDAIISSFPSDEK